MSCGPVVAQVKEGIVEKTKVVNVDEKAQIIDEYFWVVEGGDH